MTKPTVGISIDVELDGSSLLLNSCIQIGVCAFYHHASNPDPYILDSWILDKREWSILPQANKVSDPATMIFLGEQPGLLEYIGKNAQDIGQVIGEFCQWYTDVSERYNLSIIVASPGNLFLCVCKSVQNASLNSFSLSFRRLRLDHQLGCILQTSMGSCY